jgi:hypothetical protein
MESVICVSLLSLREALKRAGRLEEAEAGAGSCSKPGAIRCRSTVRFRLESVTP